MPESRRRNLGGRAPSSRLVLGFTSLLIALPGCPSHDLEQARALEMDGRVKEAGEAYVDIAKKDPANLAAWDAAVALWCTKSTNVGECMGVLDLELDLLGNVERHKDALSLVLELRARARIEQGLTDAALADLDRAQRAMPDQSTIYSARARALLRRGDKAGALESMKRAREIDRGNEEVDALVREMNAPAQPSPGDAEGFGGPR